MIAGIGLDLVEIDRVAELLERRGPGFLDRILHPDEESGSAGHLAGLFAAKEAVMKALGTGMAGANFADIRVAEGSKVELSGAALRTATELGVTGWRLSITRSGSTAVALAIALREGDS